MRSNPRSKRGYVSARVKPAIFVAAVFAAALALTGVLVPGGLLRRAAAQVTPTLGTPYTQNFDTLPASGSATWTNNSTIPGWFHARTGTGTTIVANDGSSNAGNLYSYGTGTNTDRALGSLGSGNAAIGNLFWGVRLQNNTGSTITQLDISYVGEQWRNSAAAAQTVSFSYLVGSPTVTGSLAEFQSAGVAVPQLDFTSPITGGTAGALNGNLAANRVTRTHSITGLSIPNGTEIMLRWSDPDHTGADHGLAIDDFSVTANGGGGGQPSLAVNDVSQDEGNSGQTAFTFTVSLSSSTHGGVTFDIATADGTAQDDNPATEDNDYVANSATGVTIPNGQQSAQFTVQVNGDTTQEPNETFFVNVTSVTGATVTDGQGQGTIVNDDITLTLISQVQGNGASSPVAGATVTVRGIVTLLKSNGFFLQEETADNDADPNTSEGIFVFTSSTPVVNVGDQATVTGTAVEFNGLTEISPVSNINVNSTGNALPTAVTLTPADLPPTANFAQPQLEKYEGMRLFAASLTTVAPNDSFFDVFTVLTGQPRPMREPGIPASDPVPPDPTSGTPDCCIPIWDENPERLLLDTNGRAGSTGETLTSNVTITNVAGPLDFAFGAYRLVNEANLTRSANMSAVPVPTPYATEFMVAGFNIENFNNNATQRQKAALAVRDVMRLPDIIGVAEIFDLADLQALAAEINTIAPGRNYTAHLVEANGTSEDNDQDVGYLVDESRVTVNSVVQRNATETYINPNTGNPELLNDRPPLVLDAQVRPAGANLRVLVVVNHLRSFIDIEQVAGEGPRVRAKRKAQAESLAALLQELQANNPGVPVISVGDYNAYQFSDGYTDPVATIKGNPTPDDQIVVDASPDLVNPNFVNLIDELPAEERYSFIFEGTPQAIDHVIVNTAAHERRTRIAVARNNADFPESPAAAFASNAARPERNSDHDMPVAYFSLFEAAQAGQVIISELRFRGPVPSQSPAPADGENNEFVELYNNTDNDITVAASDASEGWSVAFDNDNGGPTRLFVIPNGTVIPARGHYLAANDAGYDLSAYAAPDISFTANIPDTAGVALFTTADTTAYAMANRLDAAGIVTEQVVNAARAGRRLATTNPVYYEGTGLPGPVTADNEHSYVRKLNFGTPQDRADNGTDFILVSTDPGEFAGDLPAILGAPGPENTGSPIQRNNKIKSAYFDPVCAGGTGTALANPTPGSSPDGTPLAGCQNRARDTTPGSATHSASGTLFIRRRFVNTTSQNVTRLRFRIVDITTTNGVSVPAGTADLRPLSAGDVIITPTGGTPQTVRGLTLEQPPNQPNGGGYNSTLAVGTIDAQTPLAPNAAVNVQFRLGVQQAGTFRFFVNVEAVFGPLPASNSKTGGKANSAGTRR